MREPSTIKPEPFLKWAGGKRNLISYLAPYLRSENLESRYFEPFLGGGAAFFFLQPHLGFLSDANEELIETYIAVRDEVDLVIQHLSGMPHSKEDYYRIRESRPSSAAARAARFVYLNKTCFNGLYRVNLKGEFNVPFGRHGSNLEVCNQRQLRAASNALASASLTAGDFERVLTETNPGDVVYFDPPYTTAHTNNGFIEYNAKVFSWDDQHRLASVADSLVDNNVTVVISNADHPSIVDCYTRSGKLTPERLERWSTIASKAPKRVRTTELVFVKNVADGADR